MLEKLFLKAVQRHFKEGALTVTLPSGASARLGDGSGAPVHVHIRDTGAIRAMFADPNLGVPEMYIAGRLTLEEGDVYDLVELAKRNGGLRGSDAINIQTDFLQIERSASGVKDGIDDLLGREWAIVPEYRLDHRTARSRYPVTVVRKGLNNGVG